MKNLYIFVAFLTLSITGNAQDFSYPLGQHLVETVTDENFQGFRIDINTPTAEAIQYDWELVSNSFPTAWSYSLCDYGGCAIGIPQTGSMTPITVTEAQNGVIGWFKIQLTTGPNSGNGLVEIYVYDSEDYTRGDTVSWNITYDAATASLTAQTQDKFSIYPNPANDMVTVDGFTANNGVIYNSLGQKVSLEENGQDTLDVSHLRPGVYLVQLSTQKGVRTKRLIIK
jgi:hypothetical protein